MALPGIFPIDIHTCEAAVSPVIQAHCALEGIPSALVMSTMVLTFLAHRFRDAASLAATSNPVVSPHPPMATRILVPGAKRVRVSATVEKRGQSGGGSST